jgi:hypothetical protein
MSRPKVRLTVQILLAQPVMLGFAWGSFSKGSEPPLQHAHCFGIIRRLEAAVAAKERDTPLAFAAKKLIF